MLYDVGAANARSFIAVRDSFDTVGEPVNAEENLVVGKSITRTIALLVMFAAPADFASGQAASRGGPSPSASGASVYFVDLKDGQTVPTRFTVHFGLKGMGVAPAGSDKENSGHHHLLIDTDLPALNEPIPNDFNHLHFGAGQTEADVTLPPGPHTLQLLLGDKNHVPNTVPLMSERIRITVVDSARSPGVAQAPTASTARRHPSPPGAKVYFVYPTDGAYVTPSPVIRFGLIGMGVAPAGFEKVNTGHHHLLVDTDLPAMDQPIPNDFNHLHFGAGQTESKVTLPLGKHKLQLILADENHIPHNPPVYSQPIEVTVTSSGKEPEARRPPRQRVSQRESQRASRAARRSQIRSARAPERESPGYERASRGADREGGGFPLFFFGPR